MSDKTFLIVLSDGSVEDFTGSVEEVHQYRRQFTNVVFVEDFEGVTYYVDRTYAGNICIYTDYEDATSEHTRSVVAKRSNTYAARKKRENEAPGPVVHIKFG